MVDCTDRLHDPEGTLFLSIGLVLFVGRYLDTALHQHIGASITVSLDEPIAFRAAGGEWQRALGIVARGGAHFEARCGSARVLNVQLDPELSDGWALRPVEGAPELTPLREQLVRELRGPLNGWLSRPCVPARQLRDYVVEAVLGPNLAKPRFDVRIVRVLSILKESMPHAPSAAELAEKVELSEGRLIHLFSEQVGVPLRRYVLALRVRRLLFFLAQGHNLTDAAHAAGFCDSAHYARVHREMYGMAPSKVFRSSKVKIEFGPAAHIPEDPHHRSDVIFLADQARAR